MGASRNAVGKRGVEEIARRRRKRIVQRDEEQEFNTFYDASASNHDSSIFQQKLRKIIVIGQLEFPSLEVIAKLNNLKELWIVECGLKDAMPLGKITSLERLYLYSNKVREIPDFSNVKRLKILSLARNRISDLGGLRNSSTLRDLNVADNEIREIKGIFSTDFELSHVNLSGNPIYDLQDVDDLWILKNLESVEFDDPVYGRCPAVSGHFNYRQYLIRCSPNLGEIDYYTIASKERNDSFRNEVSLDEKNLQKYSLDGSFEWKSFEKILSSNEFSHIQHLKIVECSLSEENLRYICLPQLESLDLSKNFINSLAGLKGLTNLQTLCVSRNELGRRNAFSEENIVFPNLITFYADNNEIRSVGDSSIPKMPSLKYIFLQHNQIDDVDGIQDFPCLETVVLDNNSIEDIADDGFRCNVRLKALFLENNHLTRLGFTKKLANIEKLFIANNKITDKNQLTYLSCLGKLEEIAIFGNPVSKRSNNYREIAEANKTIRKMDGQSTMSN